jgi:hypothetical protein
VRCDRVSISCSMRVACSAGGEDCYRLVAHSGELTPHFMNSRSAIAQIQFGSFIGGVRAACVHASAHPSSRACRWTILGTGHQSAKHLPILVCRSLKSASWFANDNPSLEIPTMLEHCHELDVFQVVYSHGEEVA